MQERLCGREQEFGIWTDLKAGSELNVAQAIIKMAAKVIPGFAVNSQSGDQPDFLHHSFHPFGSPMQSRDSRECFWFKNGWKIYQDLDFVEAASAESFAGTLDAVAQEKAIERILNQALQRLRHSPNFKKLALYKNNVTCEEQNTTLIYHPTALGDPNAFVEVSEEAEKGIDLANEVSYGSHHNYSYLAKHEKEIFALLKSFVPASLPLTGNGHILRGVYVFSQRAAHVNKIKSQSNATRGDRALINIRNNHYIGEDENLSRLHLISRDATRCEFQTWLVDAITHLVLRLGEEGWELPVKLQLRRPLKILRHLNENLNLNCRLLTNSGYKSLLAYNLLFLNAAKQLSPLSLMEKKALEEWSRVLELLKAGAWKKLVGELDWATKRFLLETKMKEQGFDINSVEAWLLCQEYHNISTNPKESWFARMDEAGLIKHMVTEEQIQRAIAKPPETRAKVRGKLVSQCLRNKSFGRRIKLLDWDRAEIKFRGHDGIFYFGAPNNPQYPLKGPLKKLIYKDAKST